MNRSKPNPAAVVLVTGAGSDRGIGRAIALAFGRKGHPVGCVDVDLAGCRRVAAEIRAAGAEAIAIKADVADSTQVRATVAACVRRFDRLDVLVNNAGFVRFKPLMEVDEALWDRTLAVNLKGCFLFARAAARQMMKQGRGGCIINISSISATQAAEQKVHYCVSKAGVKMLTEGLALELARYRIRVNAIAPGDIVTNIVKDAAIQRLTRDVDFASVIPLGRRGRAEDVAGAAVFLASDEAAYVTGATITVDGGLTSGAMLPKRK